MDMPDLTDSVTKQAFLTCLKITSSVWFACLLLTYYKLHSMRLLVAAYVFL